MAKELEGKTIIMPEHTATAQPSVDAGFFAAQPKPRSRRRLIVLSAAIVFALILIATLGAWLVGNRSVAVTGCSTDQLKRAKTAITAKDKATLDTVAGDVQKDKQYTQDVNCLYVVAVSDVYQGKYDKALVSYNAFYSKYDEQTGLSRSVSNDAAADIRSLSKAMLELRAKYDQVSTDQEDLL